MNTKSNTVNNRQAIAKRRQHWNGDEPQPTMWELLAMLPDEIRPFVKWNDIPITHLFPKP